MSDHASERGLHEPPIDLADLKRRLDSFDFEGFLRGYVLEALWSSGVEEDYAARHGCAPDASMLTMGFEQSALLDETVDAMREDCEQFVAGSLSDLESYCEQLGEWVGSDSVRGENARYSAAERAGGDFWLTRCGHGTGFWDRGLGELGERLTEAAKVYGEAWLYLGDDDQVYAT